MKPLAANNFYDMAVSMGGDPAYLACIRDQFQMTAAGDLKDVDTVFDARDFASAVGRAPITFRENIAKTLK